MSKKIEKLVEAIGYTKDTNALIISAIKKENDYGLQVGSAFQQVLTQKGVRATLATYKARTWQDPREGSVVKLLEDKKFNLLIVTDMDVLGYDPVGFAKPYVHNGKKFTEILTMRKARKDARAFWFGVKHLTNWLKNSLIDFDTLALLSDQLEHAFIHTQTITIVTSPHDILTFQTNQHNQPLADLDNNSTELGSGCNIPFGEVLITPDMQSAEGSVVIDGSFYSDYTVTIKNPIRLTFKKGKVVHIDGKKEAKILQKIIEDAKEEVKNMQRTNPHITNDYIDNLYNIGEFAIGLNPVSDFCDDLLIDEKTYGTAHIALGESYHGDPSIMHCDLVMRNPTVIFKYIDGHEETVVQDRKIFLP